MDHKAFFAKVYAEILGNTTKTHKMYKCKNGSLVLSLFLK